MRVEQPINFEQMLFDPIIQRHLLYDPKIAIKPAHLANGLFRAICRQQYINHKAQHQALYPKAYPQSDNSFLDDSDNAYVREMLNELLGADHTIFKNVNQSSYTLSHSSHITNDNHDRNAGEWLVHVLKQPIDQVASPAYTLLYSLITQNDRQRSDELSVLTLPLVESEPIPQSYPSRLSTDSLPTSLHTSSSGAFSQGIVNAIRSGFDRLADNDQSSSNCGGKLDILRRMTIWGCLGVYLHLVNVADPKTLIPLLIAMDTTKSPSLRQASSQSYQMARRQINRFFRQHIIAIVETWNDKQQYGMWNTDEEVIPKIENMQWKAPKGGQKQSQASMKQHTPRCLEFYKIYRSDTANYPPYLAFANAVTDMLDVIMSADPETVAQTLGVQIGLLKTAQRSSKIYAPQPDVLELLVRASIPKNERWTIKQLATYWAKNYGIIFGSLGNENDILSRYGIQPVAGDDLLTNTEHLIDMLELCGYAKRYADGIVMIAVEE